MASAVPFLGATDTDVLGAAATETMLVELIVLATGRKLASLVRVCETQRPCSICRWKEKTNCQNVGAKLDGWSCGRDNHQPAPP